MKAHHHRTGRKKLVSLARSTIEVEANHPVSSVVNNRLDGTSTTLTLRLPPIDAAEVNNTQRPPDNGSLCDVFEIGLVNFIWLQHMPVMPVPATVLLVFVNLVNSNHVGSWCLFVKHGKCHH